ncbi:DUF2292 domain-containing protein [Facklamia sp. P13069]
MKNITKITIELSGVQETIEAPDFGQVVIKIQNGKPQMVETTKKKQFK